VDVEYALGSAAHPVDPVEVLAPCCLHDRHHVTLRRYALDDHVLVDASIAAQTPAWLRLDNIVLSWILGTISLDLHNHAGNTRNARGAWLALEGQFLGNVEARALQLDASFRTFV